MASHSGVAMSPTRVSRLSVKRWSPHHAWRLLAGVTVGVALAGAGAGTASAECDGPFPSFRDALTSAERVVIGDVLEVQPSELWDGGDGRSSRFSLGVRHVLRGSAPAVMPIRDLPTQPCASMVVARVGDRIAIAFDATDYTPPMPVNAVAWIAGTPVFEGLERYTVEEVFSLMGEPLPAVDGEAKSWAIGPIALVALLLLAAVVVPDLAQRRSGR
jgi:hypothetical protein